MKYFYRIRSLFQLMAFLSIVLVIGTIGAWENANINIVQCVLQIFAFSSIGFFCAHVSKLRPLRPARRKSRNSSVQARSSDYSQKRRTAVHSA